MSTEVRAEELFVLMSIDGAVLVWWCPGPKVPKPTKKQRTGKGLSDDQRVVINAAFAAFGPHWRDATWPSLFQVLGFLVGAKCWVAWLSLNCSTLHFGAKLAPAADDERDILNSQPYPEPLKA